MSGTVNWKDLSQHQMGSRIQLPVYPFQKRHCWFPVSDKDRKILLDEKGKSSRIFPVFSRSDYFIRDHIVKGENVVPGVKYLDIFQVAGEKISQEPIRMLKDIYWARAIKIGRAHV